MIVVYLQYIDIRDPSRTSTLVLMGVPTVTVAEEKADHSSFVRCLIPSNTEQRSRFTKGGVAVET